MWALGFWDWGVPGPSVRLHFSSGFYSHPLGTRLCILLFPGVCGA